MATTFKVWVQLERIENDPERFENAGLPDCLGTFEREEEATAFIRSLPGWEGVVAATSDYRLMEELRCPNCECTHEAGKCTRQTRNVSDAHMLHGPEYRNVEYF